MEERALGEKKGGVNRNCESKSNLMGTKMEEKMEKMVLKNMGPVPAHSMHKPA